MKKFIDTLCLNNILSIIILSLITHGCVGLKSLHTMDPIIKPLPTDSLYFKDSLDYFKKQMDIDWVEIDKQQFYVVNYTDIDGYLVRISNTKHFKSDFFYATNNVYIYPPNKYYIIYQSYDGRENIRERYCYFFSGMSIGRVESWDSSGNRTVEERTWPKVKFDINKVLAFLRAKGLVDDNAINCETMSIEFLEERAIWRISIDIVSKDGNRLFGYDYEINSRNGKFLKSLERPLHATP